MERLASKYNYKILFTPPRDSPLQPIETLWAVVKRKVASYWNNKTTLADVRVSFEETLRTVSSQAVSGCIRSVGKHEMETLEHVRNEAKYFLEALQKLPIGHPDRNEEEIKVFQRGLVLTVEEESRVVDDEVEEEPTPHRELFGEGEDEELQENGDDYRVQQPQNEDAPDEMDPDHIQQD